MCSRVDPLNREWITSYEYDGTCVILIVIRNRNRLSFAWLRLMRRRRLRVILNN